MPDCAGPHYAFVKKGIEICRNNNVECVIGIGGCSCMDIAKMIAFGAKHDDIWDYLTFKKPVTGKEKTDFSLEVFRHIPQAVRKLMPRQRLMISKPENTVHYTAFLPTFHFLIRSLRLLLMLFKVHTQGL